MNALDTLLDRCRSWRSARQESAAMSLDFYRGEHLPYIGKNPDETPEEFARRPKESLNVTRLVIDVLSGLYKDPPMRRVAGNPELAARLATAWRENAMDAFMLNVDRLVRLTGLVAVRPFYEPEGDRGHAPEAASAASGSVRVPGSGDGGSALRYWAYTPEQLEAVADPERPWRALGLAVRWTENGPRGNLARRAQLWTDDVFLDLVDGAVRQERANPYGLIPFAVFRDALPALGGGFFPPGRGPELAESNAVLDMRLSDDLFTLKMQGFGVAEVVNPAPDEPLVLSPGRGVRFEGRSDAPMGISFKSTNAPLADLLSDIRERVSRILLAHRIPESAVSVSLAPGASGIAIRAANTPIDVDRSERRALFGPAEEELARLSARVLAAHEPCGGFEGEFGFNIDYAEPQERLTEAERIARAEFDLRHGLITPWDLALARDPDGFAEPGRAPRDVARERILRNRKEMNDVG
jgi:hypothetical protein